MPKTSSSSSSKSPCHLPSLCLLRALWTIFKINPRRVFMFFVHVHSPRHFSQKQEKLLVFLLLEENCHRGFQTPHIEHFKYPGSAATTSSIQNSPLFPPTFTDHVARSICLRRFSKSTFISRSTLNCSTFCFDHWADPSKLAFLLVASIELNSCAINATLWGK